MSLEKLNDKAQKKVQKAVRKAVRKIFSEGVIEQAVIRARQAHSQSESAGVVLVWISMAKLSRALPCAAWSMPHAAQEVRHPIQREPLIRNYCRTFQSTLSARVLSLPVKEPGCSRSLGSTDSLKKDKGPI